VIVENGASCFAANWRCLSWLAGDRTVQIAAWLSARQSVEIILAPGPLPQYRSDVFPLERVVARDLDDLPPGAGSQ
jgi:hypothetical protein